MFKVFITHSSADTLHVRNLEKIFITLGCQVSQAVEPGEELSPWIEKEILGCDGLVVVLSHASANSSWINREVQFARASGTKVFAVRIDDCKPPASIYGRDVVDLQLGHLLKLSDSPAKGWPLDKLSKFVLKVTLPANIPPAELEADLVELYTAMNDWHIARGGSGLSVEDFKQFIAAGILQPTAGE